MADDWRVAVTVSHAARAGRLAQAVRKRLAADDRYHRLGYRVVMSVDGPRLFLYADSEDAAREADRVVREVLALRQLNAAPAVDRWHPVAQDWQDAGVPMPQSDDAVAAERRRLMEAEAKQSRATGRAAWQLRVQLPSLRAAVDLAGRLRAGGHPVVRRWKYLILGADNEEEACALAEMIRQGAPANTSIQVSPAAHIDVRPFVVGEAAAVFFYL